jgi:glycerol-3-phosphate acyltransferase PlsY
MVKVAIPVFIFHFFFPNSPAEFLAAAGGIIGHNWPIFYQFKGGYGHSPIYGALAVLEWSAIPISFFGTAILYLIFRQVHYASLGGILLLIPWLWYLDYDIYALSYAGVCSLAYFIKIYPDFRAVQKLKNQKDMEKGTEV